METQRNFVVIGLLGIVFGVGLAQWALADDNAFQFLEEEAKVVAATLREQKPADAPASVTVVTAKQIKQKGYRTIKDIMLDVPGFTDVSDGNEEIVAIRGTFASTTNKILTLVNGHRMNDLMLGRYNTDQFIGLDTVDHVEFIRGRDEPSTVRARSWESLISSPSAVAR